MSGNKLQDLKNRFIFLLLALLVYRLASHIPIAGINPLELEKIYDSQSNGVLGFFNMFSGGALSRLSILTLGIMPYISASIVMQLLTTAVPSLEELKKEGSTGTKKINQYTRYFTFVLALIQSFGVSFALFNQPNLVFLPQALFTFTTVVGLTTGSIFVMWLGEQITERGLGNGISLLVFAGIAAGMPVSLAQVSELAQNGSISPFVVIILLILVVLVTYFVVFIERGQRKILINYAKRQIGNKIYGGQASHLPLKVNVSGVIPPIFASSIILFPATIVGWIGSSGTSSNGVLSFLSSLKTALSPGEPLFVILYALAIVFFAFFYTGLMFNSRDVADNLKRGGAFVPGVRPGENTKSYIDGILLKLTLIGAIYLIFVCLLPEILRTQISLPFYFGGTSLLIIVVVAMDFMTQVQSYLVSQQYEPLMKKAGLINSKRT